MTWDGFMASRDMVDMLDELPTGSVVMTETFPDFGAYEQRVWQKFGGEPSWQYPDFRHHEWQSTDGGFERVGTEPRCRGTFTMGRKVTVLYRPPCGADEVAEYPTGTVVRIPATTGTSFGVRGTDGRWRRLVVAPKDPGVSSEQTLPNAEVLYVPEAGA